VDEAAQSAASDEAAELDEAERDELARALAELEAEEQRALQMKR
jgi:hypothetical protein